MDYNYQPKCVFCQIVAYESPARVEFADDYTLAFHPIDPVVENHLLVIPKYHVSDFTDDESWTGIAAARAAVLAKRFDNANLITSKGSAATQSVFHLHFHIVPRAKGDGLLLPWSGQIRS